MLSFNRKFKLVMGLPVLLSILFQIAESKSQRKVYCDKLEFIRDFIEANFPIDPEYYIQVETSTGWYQNFWQFCVTVGDVTSIDEAPVPVSERTEPEYVFEFHISATFEPVEVRVLSFKKVEENIKKLNEKLPRKKEIDVEEVRKLLIEMGAKYPFGQGKVIKFPDGSVRIEDCGTEELKKDLLKRKNLWDFLGGGVVNIRSIAFVISADPEEKDFIEISNLFWGAKVKVNKTEYRVWLDPFYGYIKDISLH